jgi:hypothetical protein
MITSYTMSLIACRRLKTVAYFNPSDTPEITERAAAFPAQGA